jgi:hypothetical protein
MVLELLKKKRERESHANISTMAGIQEGQIDVDCYPLDCLSIQSLEKKKVRKRERTCIPILIVAIKTQIFIENKFCFRWGSERKKGKKRKREREKRRKHNKNFNKTTRKTTYFFGLKF